MRDRPFTGKAVGNAMHDNANDNPIWDAAMGETTDTAVLRMVAAIVVFAVVGGAIAWLIG